MGNSCPVCMTYDVQQTTEPDENGVAEFRCNECGEYFTDDADGEGTK